MPRKMTKQTDFCIVIVGGGIAGLLAAIALRGPGRHITILERSSMLRETGALLSLQPNASKILASWNLDAFLADAKPVNDRCFRLVDTDGQVVREIRLDPTKYGADRVVYHRQDLHTALRNAATSPERPGPVPVLRTSSCVKACDPDVGTLTLAGGETVNADLIIGADGIHSVVRTSVLKEVVHAQPTGVSAYRLLLPTTDLADIDLPPAILDPVMPATTMIVGHDKRVIMGPGRGGKMFGLVALVPDEKMHEKASTESWVETGSLDKLLEAYDDFPPWLHAVFTKAPEIGLWQLRDIDPLSRWVRGRTILIGDAAHAMLPTQGQGASQSVEDAEALQAMLSGMNQAPALEVLQAALTKVFEARHERASLIQAYSREQSKPGTAKGSKEIKLDPEQFMGYNCNYAGAVDWLQRQASKSK